MPSSCPLVFFVATLFCPSWLDGPCKTEVIFYKPLTSTVKKAMGNNQVNRRRNPPKILLEFNGEGIHVSMDPTIQDRARRNQQVQQVGPTQRAFTGVGNLPSRRLILLTGCSAPAVTILRSEQTSEC